METDDPIQNERADRSRSDTSAGLAANGHTTALERAIRHAGASVMSQDADLRILWMVNMPAAWRQAKVGRREREALPTAEGERLTEAKLTVLLERHPDHLELPFESQRGTRWFDIRIEPQTNSDNRVTGVISTMIDITEQRQREQVLRTLLREVSHRSKNLLAIIQSIAAQTGRHSDTIETFLSRFRGRLQSLASSQDLVTLSNWRGADLSELVANQVHRYGADTHGRVRLSGADPHLNPNAALHIGLALHELTANSISYGTLSQGVGRISLEAQFIERDGERRFILAWAEPVIAPSQERPERRFGSLALEHVVPTSLRGRAEWTVGPEAVRYRLDVPAVSVVA